MGELASSVQCLEGNYTECVYRVSVLPSAEISEWP